MPADRPRAARPRADAGRLRQVKPAELLTRFALGAVISVGAGVLGKTVGPRFAGMFLAFPAILPASLTLVQEKEGTRRAGHDAVGAVLGGLGLALFAGTAEAAFGTTLSPFLGLALALAVWLVAALGLYGLLAFLHPEVCQDDEAGGRPGG